MGKSVPGTKRDRHPERGVPGFFVHPSIYLAHLSQRIVDLPAADVPRRTGDRIPIERDGDSAFPILWRRKRPSSGFLVEIWVSQGFQFSLRGDGDAVSVVLGRRDPWYAWLHIAITLSQAASVAGGADVVELASVLAACEAPM